MRFRKPLSKTRPSLLWYALAASEFRKLKSLIWVMAMSGSIAIADNLHSPAAVYAPPLDLTAVFVNNDNGYVYDKYWIGQQQQSMWEGRLGKPPGAAARNQTVLYGPEPNQIHVFVEGDNGHLYERSWNGAQWEDWLHPFGTNSVFGPSAANYVLGLSVSVVGDDGHVYESAEQGGHQLWRDRGAPPGRYTRPYAPTSAIYEPTTDRIFVFVAGDDGHLYDVFWNGATIFLPNGQQWQDQGTPPGFPSTPLINPSAVYQSALHRIFVFVAGYDGHLYDKYWDAQQQQWSEWEDQGTAPGGVKTNFPSAVYQSALDRIVVFVIGSNGHLYDKYWNGQQWLWEDQGIPPGANYILGQAPSPVYQTPYDRLVVFVTGNNGNLYDKYWDGRQQQWVWADQGNPSMPTLPTFSLTATPVYYPGNKGIKYFTVGVTAQNGFNGPVTLSCNVPGSTCILSPDTIVGSGTSILTGPPLPGDWDGATLTGTSGSVVKTLDLTLDITPEPCPIKPCR